MSMFSLIILIIINHYIHTFSGDLVLAAWNPQTSHYSINHPWLLLTTAQTHGGKDEQWKRKPFIISLLKNDYIFGVILGREKGKSQVFSGSPPGSPAGHQRGDTSWQTFSSTCSPTSIFGFWFGAARGLSQEWFLTYIWVSYHLTRS